METSAIIEKFDSYQNSKLATEIAHQDFLVNLIDHLRDLALQLEWEPDPYNQLRGLVSYKPNLDKELFSKIKIDNIDLSKHYFFINEIFPNINIKKPDPTLIRFRAEYIEIIDYDIKLNSHGLKIKQPEPPKISLPIIQPSKELIK